MRFGNRIALATFVVVVSHVAGFVLIFIVPQFKMRWDNAGASLPLSKELLIRASDFMAQWFYVVLPMVFAAAVLFVVAPMLRSRPASPD